MSLLSLHLPLLLSLHVPLAVVAQQPGTKREGNPTIAFSQCTKAGCTTKQAKLVLDANWRWIHDANSKNCYDGALFDVAMCPDPDTCAHDCQLEGVTAADYKGTYGITPVPGGVKLAFMTGENVGSRMFLLDDDGENYMMLNLKNREFTLDVDVSHVECGMNGAMYFVEMDENGGKGKGNNTAGAAYGTGYCDAQCPHDIKFINGIANSQDWKANTKDKSGNMGMGHWGSCCHEMDIWEANSMSQAYTPHPCKINTPGQHMCENTECGSGDERYEGICDKDGCDINPFRNGEENFYGKGAGFAVDSSKPFTVVTQFLTTDGTDKGDLSEIRRYYVQNGNKIEDPTMSVGGAQYNSITDEYCDAVKTAFDDPNDFQKQGGLAQMGQSLDRGHVATFSLWDDVDVSMQWLDSTWPRDKVKPGQKRGNCPGGDESSPMAVRKRYGASAWVSFANVKFGPIDTTQNGGSPAPPPAPHRPNPNPSRGGGGGGQQPQHNQGRSGGGCCQFSGGDCSSCVPTSKWCDASEDRCKGCNANAKFCSGGGSEATPARPQAAPAPPPPAVRQSVVRQQPQHNQGRSGGGCCQFYGDCSSCVPTSKWCDASEDRCKGCNANAKFCSSSAAVLMQSGVHHHGSLQQQGTMRMDVSAGGGVVSSASEVPQSAAAEVAAAAPVVATSSKLARGARKVT